MSLTPQEGDIIDVWFSCGAASAVALQETLRLFCESISETQGLVAA